MEDRAAREAFVRDAYAGLFRWFRRLSGCPDLAADLTQDTFAAYWASAHKVRQGVTARTWLYAIGRNLWRKRIRDRKPHATAEDDLPAAAPSPERGAQDREFREHADEAIGALPPDLREVFTLRFWHEFTYEEIGQVQRISADLARWRYFAARRRLHEALKAWDPRREQPEEDRHAR